MNRRAFFATLAGAATLPSLPARKLKQFTATPSSHQHVKYVDAKGNPAIPAEALSSGPPFTVVSSGWAEPTLKPGDTFTIAGMYE